MDREIEWVISFYREPALKTIGQWLGLATSLICVAGSFYAGIQGGLAAGRNVKKAATSSWMWLFGKPRYDVLTLKILHALAQNPRPGKLNPGDGRQVDALRCDNVVVGMEPPRVFRCHFYESDLLRLIPAKEAALVVKLAAAIHKRVRFEYEQKTYAEACAGLPSPGLPEPEEIVQACEPRARQPPEGMDSLEREAEEIRRQLVAGGDVFIERRT